MELQTLSKLLRSSRAPLPSSGFDQKMMQVMFEERQKFVDVKPRWKRIFNFSINIPAPIFALAILAVVAAIGIANLVGRYAASSAESGSSTKVDTLSRPPEIVEQTKTIEVPIVQERVVNRVVYVQRAVLPQKKPQTRFAGSRENEQDKVGPRDRSLAGHSLGNTASVTGNGYLTQANLTALQPTKEMKVRIIKGVKINEK